MLIKIGKSLGFVYSIFTSSMFLGLDTSRFMIPKSSELKQQISARLASTQDSDKKKFEREDFLTCPSELICNEGGRSTYMSMEESYTESHHVCIILEFSWAATIPDKINQGWTHNFFSFSGPATKVRAPHPSRR